MRSRISRLIMAALILVLPAWGQGMTQGILSPPANVRPPGLKNVGIEQRLNEQIPPALTFRDETGKSVQLGDYFGKKPMILNLVYYQCPMLCGEVLSGLESALRVLKFDVGKEFDVLTISFDPERNARNGLSEKGGILEALRTARCGAGLAFPDWPRGLDRCADQSSWISVSVRPQERPVCSRNRDHGADARGKNRAILLRSRIRAQGFASGIDSGIGEQDRHRG